MDYLDSWVLGLSSTVRGEWITEAFELRDIPALYSVLFLVCMYIGEALFYWRWARKGTLTGYITVLAYDLKLECFGAPTNNKHCATLRCL